MKASWLLTNALVAALCCAACNSTSKITQDAPATPSAASGTAVLAAGDGAHVAAASSAHDEHGAGGRVVMAAPDADALSLVRTERLRAKAEGRVLVVYAGAGWCEPCKRFKNAIESGSLDDKLAKTTLLVFDADRDTERLAAAGYKLQFIPYVAMPGADGAPADSAEARAKGSESWRELIAKLESWQATGLR